MASSKATTVEAYLNELPLDRRLIIEEVRDVIRKNLPKGYVEGIQYGMIGYGVPLSLFPDGYRGDKKTPLPYAGLASLKQYCSLYLMNVYGHKETETWFRAAFKKAEKKLNMGKSCVRFRKLEDLPLDVIGQAIARTPAEKYLAAYRTSRKSRRS